METPRSKNGGGSNKNERERQRGREVDLIRYIKSAKAQDRPDLPFSSITPSTFIISPVHTTRSSSIYIL